MRKLFVCVLCNDFYSSVIWLLHEPTLREIVLPHRKLIGIFPLLFNQCWTFIHDETWRLLLVSHTLSCSNTFTDTKVPSLFLQCSFCSGFISLIYSKRVKRKKKNLLPALERVMFLSDKQRLVSQCNLPVLQPWGLLFLFTSSGHRAQFTGRTSLYRCCLGNAQQLGKETGPKKKKEFCLSVVSGRKETVDFLFCHWPKQVCCFELHRRLLLLFRI